MIRKKVFKNGLRVVTKKLPTTESVTVLILIGAGSRYESKENSGISHFLEHMFFKGAKKYRNAKEVAEAVDSVGGDFNAFTGKEYVGYYIKAASRNKKVAFDVLSDMLLYSRFDSHEIDKERGVILEEYNMYQDTPMYQVGWDFERLLFGDQPMGWDTIGKKEFIQKAKHEHFKEYKESLYVPKNIVIGIAGDVSHDEACAAAEKYFHFAHIKKKFNFAPLLENKSKDRVHAHHKKTEQAHLVIGFPAYPEEHKNFYAEKTLAVMLGGNMSSRMFLAVREAKGLAYYIQTNTDDYIDAGVISTRAGVDVNRIELAVSAIINEYKKIREEKIGAKELKKAKEFLKGKLALRLEDSEEYAHLIGKYELLHDKIRTPEEIEKAIDGVSSADIKKVAEELFDFDKMYIAVIGPYEDKEKFVKLWSAH